MTRRLKSSVLVGFKAGFKTWWWIAKMTIMATLLVVFLQWGGVIELLSGALSPTFALFGLSAGAVLVFLTASLANIYAAIGVMATLSVDYREATILAVMALICHNLIIETIIQRRSGANPYAMVVLRLFIALLAAVVLNLVLPTHNFGTLILDKAVTGDGTLISSLQSWVLNMVTMLPVMLGLILALNIGQSMLREFGLIGVISKPFAPVMKLFGLSPKSSIIWLVLNSLGLAYGGSVMIAERDSGALDEREGKLLNTHIAISHSLVEDTLLFVALGLSLFWLIVPRVIFAILCVWIQRFYYWYRERNGQCCAPPQCYDSRVCDQEVDIY